MTQRLRIPALVAMALSLAVRPAAAQVDGRQFEIGVQLVSASASEFDSTDHGVSGRFVWRPGMLLGAEAEVGVFPRALGGNPAFSRARIEALFGMTVGPRLGKWRPFGKVRSGAVQFLKPSEPFACIAIYPPPLPCALAGARVQAYEFGGGLEFWGTDSRFLRGDVSDRLMRYDAPVRANGQTYDDGFYGHDIRVSVGAGFRF